MAITSSGSEPGEPIPPPSSIRRYGPNTWAPWRETSRQDPNPRPPRILQLDGPRRISGFSYKDDGLLRSIATKSLDGKEEIAGEHQPSSSRSLREFDGSTMTPTHLSGDEKRENWSLCLHYQ